MRGRGGGLLCSTLMCRISFVGAGGTRRIERQQGELQKVGNPTTLLEGSHGKHASCSGTSGTVPFGKSVDRSGDEVRMQALLQEHEQRRIARREAFLKWQAGQREKGAAHRLVRQAKTQEKFKRHHYHTQSGRLISVALSHNVGSSSSGKNADGVMDFASSRLHEGERGRATSFLLQCGSGSGGRTLNGR
ncbi:excreted/secreted protein 23 [Trypanosoma rangeli]|uniref:Excreted/secreted protein 23 n=1 Tax=Trypanosoma rangeli TaxID=5698 RepID=A0A422N5P9_TRYRA|nr:excreted/secreted protein 23 [Trypanosoma rangeli]RNF00807.1 excreted/secreted protein 23 [Trypanosoma rangeli]|eukprot:RNF00807.1 excreted/secreted protein 23 [Trypanosoma rangeli]